MGRPANDWAPIAKSPAAPIAVFVYRRLDHTRRALDALAANDGASESDVIIFSDYNKGSLVNVAEMIRMARDAGRTVMVDPKGDDFTPYRGATMLTPNKSELKRIVGTWKTEEQLTEKAQRLREELELEVLLLTRSEEGMSLYTADEVLHVHADAREVFDVSGAGDTVIATMAAMLGTGAPLAEALATANRAGGIVVGKLGTATVTREELFPQRRRTDGSHP